MNECNEANFYPDRFIWRKLELEEEYVEPEEKYITSDEEDAVRIEEFEVKKKCGEEEIRKLEDDRVLDKTTNLTICEDVDIPQENLQQKSIPKNYFYNKSDERQEIDKVLEDIYALFNKIKPKRIWQKHHQYFKFVGLLPNKRKKKDDVFFVSYMPP